MAHDTDNFVIVPVQRLPAVRQDKSSDEVAAQLDMIRERIVSRSDDELLADHDAVAMLRELGSDLIIVAYMFNFKINGSINTDIHLTNELNTRIYNRFSLLPDRDDVANTPLLLNASRFDPLVYGNEFTNDLKRRLGIVDDANTPLNFLISTTMNPMITDTAEGNFIPTLIETLREGVVEIVDDMRSRTAD